MVLGQIKNADLKYRRLIYSLYAIWVAFWTGFGACKSVISFFHSLLCKPLENVWGTYLNHCVNIHLYMEKCTKHRA